MSAKLMCPLCFKISKKTEYKFFCENEGEVISRKSTFSKSVFMERLEGVEFCPKCNTPTNTVICPHCEGLLPSSILSCSPITFSIIGMQSSGKSHFISQIIDRIYSLIPVMNWDLMAADSQSLGKYARNYRNPLYLRRELISKTQSHAIADNEKRPLLYLLQLSRPHSNKRILLSLHDSAGEDLENLEGIHLKADYSHLIFSSGILILIDPLQFEKVRKNPKMRNYINKFGLPPVHSKASKILEKIVNLLGKNVSKIPLAVAFSKMDAVSELFGTDCCVYSYQENKGYLNLQDIRSLNDDMYAWLSEYQGDDDVLKQISKFSKKSIFGFSALGSSLDIKAKKPILLSNPAPLRVEDPFLWLMYSNGLIKGR